MEDDVGHVQRLRLADPAVDAIVCRTTEAPEEAPALDDLLGSLAEAVPTPLLVVDRAGALLCSNRAARSLLDSSLDQVLRHLVSTLASGSTRTTLELGGRRLHARITDGVGGWVAMLEDVTAPRRAPQVLARAVSTDPLTGAASRTGFDAALAEVLGDATGPVSLILVDLDGFKRVNEQHGRAAGDHVLKVVAARLRGEVRPTDLVARLGGDGFAVLCPGLPVDAAPEMATRLVAAVRDRITVGQTRIVVGASAGPATSPPAPADPARLLAAAEAAMSREGTVDVWQPVMEL